MLSFNFKSRTPLIKHPKANCSHLYVLVCVLAHPCAAAAGADRCMLDIWLNPKTWKHHFLYNDAGISAWFKVLGAGCWSFLLSNVHWCVLSHRRSVVNVCNYCIYHDQDCYLLSPGEPLTTRRHAAAAVSWWIPPPPPAASPRARSIPVELLLNLEMTMSAKWLMTLWLKLPHQTCCLGCSFHLHSQHSWKTSCVIRSIIYLWGSTKTLPHSARKPPLWRLRWIWKPLWCVCFCQCVASGFSLVNRSARPVQNAA